MTFEEEKMAKSLTTLDFGRCLWLWFLAEQIPTMLKLELFRLEFLLLAVETIGVLVFDFLNKFNSQIMKSSAHVLAWI